MVEQVVVVERYRRALRSGVHAREPAQALHQVNLGGRRIRRPARQRRSRASCGKTPGFSEWMSRANWNSYCGSDLNSTSLCSFVMTQMPARDAERGLEVLRGAGGHERATAPAEQSRLPRT